MGGELLRFGEWFGWRSARRARIVLEADGYALYRRRSVYGLPEFVVGDRIGVDVGSCAAPVCIRRGDVVGNFQVLHVIVAAYQ